MRVCDTPRGLLRVMSQPRELPMAPAGCSLDDSGLSEQLDRYRQLGRAAADIRDGNAELVITFRADVDIDLMRATIAIERGCCSFFTLDYDLSARRLSIGIDDPARADALQTLLAAIRDSAPASARRREQDDPDRARCVALDPIPSPAGDHPGARDGDAPRAAQTP
jgi:hypothetical protein